MNPRPAPLLKTQRGDKARGGGDDRVLGLPERGLSLWAGRGAFGKKGDVVTEGKEGGRRGGCGRGRTVRLVHLPGEWHRLGGPPGRGKELGLLMSPG